jgi:hypothetical protein
MVLSSIYDLLIFTVFMNVRQPGIFKPTGIQLLYLFNIVNTNSCWKVMVPFGKKTTEPFHSFYQAFSASSHWYTARNLFRVWGLELANNSAQTTAEEI